MTTYRVLCSNYEILSSASSRIVPFPFYSVVVTATEIDARRLRHLFVFADARKERLVVSNAPLEKKTAVVFVGSDGTATERFLHLYTIDFGSLDVFDVRAQTHTLFTRNDHLEFMWRSDDDEAITWKTPLFSMPSENQVLFRRYYPFAKDSYGYSATHLDGAVDVSFEHSREALMIDADSPAEIVVESVTAEELANDVRSARPRRLYFSPSSQEIFRVCVTGEHLSKPNAPVQFGNKVRLTGAPRMLKFKTSTRPCAAYRPGCQEKARGFNYCRECARAKRAEDSDFYGLSNY